MFIIYLCTLELLLSHPGLNYAQLWVKKLRTKKYLLPPWKYGSFVLGWWRNRLFDLRCLLDFSPISWNSPHPEMTGNLKHRCRKSRLSQQPKGMFASALFQRNLLGSGGRFHWGTFWRLSQTHSHFEYLLLSPRRILCCKWFPSAFAENGTVCPASCWWNYCISLVGVEFIDT